MNYLIHYLDAGLLFLIACFPSGFNMIVPTRAKYPIQTHCIINTALAIVLTICLNGKNVVLSSYKDNPPIIHIVGAIIVVGILCVLVEFFISQMLFYKKMRVFAKGIKIPAYADTKWYDVFWVILQSVSEEIVLKCSVYYILAELFGISNPIILCAILTFIFAINHVFWGWEQVVQKMAVGALISILFVMNESLVWCAIVPHIILNVTYFVLAKRRCPS